MTPIQKQNRLLLLLSTLVPAWLLASTALAATPAAHITWLGTPSEKQVEVWHDQGFSVSRLTCTADVPACLADALSGKTGANYLFVDQPYTTQLLSLYATGALEEISAVVLFGADSVQQAPRPAGRRPKLLVLAEESAPETLVQNSRRLAAQLEQRGIPATFLFVGSGDLGETESNRGRDIMLHFLGLGTVPPDFAALLDAHHAWVKPPFDNQPLRSRFDLLALYRVNSDVEDLFRYFFRSQPFQLKQWKLDNYLAFDLLEYRDRIAPSARYVTLANRRGQQFFMDLEQYGAYEPVIIVGVDDETNMYRFVWFYRTKKMYSWKDDVQNISARTLGPVLHFRRRLPDELAVPLLLRSALTLSGIQFSETDPLAEFTRRRRRSIT